MKWKNSVIYLLLAAALTAGSICLIGLYREFHMYKEAQDTYMVFQADGSDDLSKTVADAVTSNQYPGMVGLIRSKDNLIRYPIMQGEDNEYYLTHMANGQSNALGSIFLDCNAMPDFTSPVSVIYGHHVKNNRMFGPLDRYKEKEYYEAYPVMELYTADEVYEMEIIAAYLVDGNSESYPSAGADKEEINTYIQSVMDRSFFQCKEVDDWDKNVIILSTCSYEYEDARLAVVGVIDRREQ